MQTQAAVRFDVERSPGPMGLLGVAVLHGFEQLGQRNGVQLERHPRPVSAGEYEQILSEGDRPAGLLRGRREDVADRARGVVLHERNLGQRQPRPGVS